jgi:hypothetical protein
MVQLTTPKLRLLSAAIAGHFHKLDTPPADELYVPIELIYADSEQANTFYATVRYIVIWGKRKVHSVRIKFQIDPSGRFLENTWSYEKKY